MIAARIPIPVLLLKLHLQSQNVHGSSNAPMIRSRCLALPSENQQSGDPANIDRIQSLLRRAEALRQEQASIAAELAETTHLLPSRDSDSEDGDDDDDDELDAKLVGGDIPPGILRSELERLLGLRPQEDEEDPLAGGIPFDEAEQFARAVEEGHASLEAPDGFYDAEAEPADEFMARLDASVAQFEEMLLSKKEQARRRRERITASGGCREDDSEDEFRQLMNEVPMFPSDFTQNIPMPNIPEQATAQIERAERVLLVLRRALLGDGGVPCAGVDALKARGLLADDVLFQDPWVAAQGVTQVQGYLVGGMEWGAGVRVDLDTLFSSYYEYEPDVRCRAVAHTLLRMPLPNWYIVYSALHQPSEKVPFPATEEGAPRHRPGQTILSDLGENPPGGTLFPRHELGEHSRERERGRAHVRWLQHPAFQNLGRTMVLVPNPLSATTRLEDREEHSPNSDDVMSCIPLDGVVDLRSSSSTTTSPSAARVDYSQLVAASDLISGKGWYSESSSEPLPHPPPPPLPREGGVADLDNFPLTPDEAEQLLCQLLGDKFDTVAGQLPEKKVIQGSIPSEVDMMEVQIGATWVYEIDPGTGCVCSIDVHWGSLSGAVGGVRDAYDVYVVQTGLIEHMELVF